jgi:hypothetical protein
MGPSTSIYKKYVFLTKKRKKSTVQLTFFNELATTSEVIWQLMMFGFANQDMEMTLPVHDVKSDLTASSQKI